MDLEVQVRGTGGVAAVADVADDRARRHPADTFVGIARQVGPEVLVAVVAVDPPRQAPDVVAPVLDANALQILRFDDTYLVPPPAITA
jgi:hypothetical protein